MASSVMNVHGTGLTKRTWNKENTRLSLEKTRLITKFIVIHAGGRFDGVIHL